MKTYKFRKYHYIQLLFCVILFNLLQGCANQQPSPTVIPPGKWFSTILIDPQCQPPCWRMIIAGKTTINEAMDLLMSQKDVRDLRLEGTPNNGQQVDIMWTFKDDNSAGWIPSDSSGQDVKQIFLGSYLNMPLSTLIDRFGEPDHIYIVDFMGNGNVPDIYFTYSKYNLVLEGGGFRDNWSVNIGKDFKISRFSFIAGFDFSQKYDHPSHPERSLEWTGFGGYKIPPLK